MNNETIAKNIKSKNKRKQKQLIKKSQDLVKQSMLKSNNSSQIDSGFKTSFSSENNSNESFVDKPFEQAEEEEMSYFYVDPTTGEIQTITMEQDKLIRSEKLKLRYIKEYGISELAFQLTQKFFDEFKNDYYLCTAFLKRIMIETINRRTDITADEKDIDRVLGMLDTDCDGKINLGEFFQLLILFLSSKFNLKERINGLLSEQSYTHEIEGYLTVEEARTFGHFLFAFYGINKDTENLQFISNLYYVSSSDHTIHPYKIDYEEVSYTYYSSEIYQHINEFCFVK